jgi:hypothetical protein
MTERMRAWRAANPERNREMNRRSAEKNREKRNAAQRLRNRVSAGIVGATDERRSGACPICSTDGPLVCDHDHQTGAIRGWICNDCNVGLGRLGDCAAIVEKALQYLRQ